MNTHVPREWPDDADGQVFRNLRDRSFDFEQKSTIEFNVDFDEWPPDPAALRKILQLFPCAEQYVEDGSDHGTIIVKVHTELDYRFVVDTQKTLTDIVSDFGGWCDSWGVLH